MIGPRSRYSLAQFLELHNADFVLALVNKHEMQLAAETIGLLSQLVRCFRNESDEKLLSLLEEIIQTSNDLCTRVKPKYRYDERFFDLSRCLQLDGYIIKNKQLIQTDPSISDAPPLDDDLIQGLKASGLSDAEAIIQKIDDSSKSFRSSPPNFNACLNDIRIALATLARSIAETRQPTNGCSFDSTKWGSVIAFLKNIEFITTEEEKGLAGVYGFISPGSHKPLGIEEEQMARLGRSLALGMCWFLVKSYRSSA